MNTFLLNQQFQQGCVAAQQAALAEGMGNLPGAIACLDQAIGFIGGSMNLALQSAVPIPDNIFFSYSFCQFNAARTKLAAGWPQAAPLHLAQALQAINQALALRPNVAYYHSAAGVILSAQGNIPVAIQAFQHAVQLNPADAWSQWMLASLNSAQGNVAAANQYYAVASQAQPSLPPPQQFVERYTRSPFPATPPPPPPSPGSAAPPPLPATAEKAAAAPKHDWFELINNALKFGVGVSEVVQKFGSGGGAGAHGGAAGGGGFPGLSAFPAQPPSPWNWRPQ